jgi:hypothetical protein
MLENYFGTMNVDDESRKRLLAVQAALEIVKTSVGASTAMSGSKVGYDLDYAIDKITDLSDAIQDALEPDSK